MKKLISVFFILLFLLAFIPYKVRAQATIKEDTTIMVQGHINSQYDAITGYTSMVMVCDGSGTISCQVSTTIK